MRTALALLLLASSAPPAVAMDNSIGIVIALGAALADPGGTFAWHSAVCNKYVASAESQFAGDTIEFSADGRLVYNGEVTKPVFEAAYGEGFIYRDQTTHQAVLAVGWRDQYSAAIEVFAYPDTGTEHDIALWEAACQ